MARGDEALAGFGGATRAWFARRFAEATAVQRGGWPAIRRGEHALLCAPTGSGKTLAAFLACLDRLAHTPAAGTGVRVLYVSPLKALAYDIERNLAAPLLGITEEAARLGESLAPVRVATRTGDTTARERRRLARDPAEILITTPESLYLLLGSEARRVLDSVETVIVDEIHALAPDKRGAHLMLSLERLSARVRAAGRPDPQRIGLSATQRPLEEVARFLGGQRPVAIVDAGERPRLDLTIEVPIDDLDAPPPAILDGGAVDAGAAEARSGIWPALHARVLELIAAHRSTIVFCNSRRLCERLAQRLNELWAEQGHQGALTRAHHGSLARDKRVEIEALLKAGTLRGLCATSSLELGIDMDAVDLVVQIESPGAVARGLQRVGRAGHAVGRRSQARIFPKFSQDLLEAAVVARGMLDGEVEPVRVPSNPLDVLAQQLVAMTVEHSRTVEELEAMVHAAYPFRALPRELLLSVLDMLAGRFPSTELADLRPRVIWDRAADTVTARKDARLIAIANAGTIPDRGLYGVYLEAGGPRLGELDEEMVHESRVGQTFLLGASSWRIVEITRDRVIVRPAPGEPGRMPFWRGEGPGRPIELGRAIGAFLREIEPRLDDGSAPAWLAERYLLDARAAGNLVRHLAAQRAATGVLPSDRVLVVERFRDELGDFRVCLHSPLGARVHAPLALLLEAQARGAQALSADEGIVLRFADADAPPSLQALLPAPEEVEELLLAQLRHSSLFASRFRQNAARALLLPRRRPGQRTPLWAQRLRAQTLLAVAGEHPSFPIVLETYRECLHDVFDLAALRELLERLRSGASPSYR
jgi:ATP-dependent Lhr-like helicase